MSLVKKLEGDLGECHTSSPRIALKSVCISLHTEKLFIWKYSSEIGLIVRNGLILTPARDE